MSGLKILVSCLLPGLLRSGSNIDNNKYSAPNLMNCQDSDGGDKTLDYSSRCRDGVITFSHLLIIVSNRKPDYQDIN